jgi:hypothetical protein
MHARTSFSYGAHVGNKLPGRLAERVKAYIFVAKIPCQHLHDYPLSANHSENLMIASNNGPRRGTL